MFGMGGLNLRGANGGRISVSRSDRRINTVKSQQGDTTGSAEIGDRASAANGVPARTVYYIEQLRVILKSRVWDAEERSVEAC